MNSERAPLCIQMYSKSLLRRTQPFFSPPHPFHAPLLGSRYQNRELLTLTTVSTEHFCLRKLAVGTQLQMLVTDGKLMKKNVTKKQKHTKAAQAS